MNTLIICVSFKNRFQITKFTYFAYVDQQVTSHSPDLTEASTTTTPGGRPLHSSSKPFEDDYQSSGSTYASSSSRKVGRDLCMSCFKRINLVMMFADFSVLL